MQIDLINQTYRENIDEFKLKTAKRKWDMLIMVVEGECTISFREKQKTVTVRKNEIALMPAGIEFERTVASPLTCYNFSFYSQADHPFYLSVKEGMLKIPNEQSEAVFRTMKRAFMLPSNRELITHTIEHIFAESYLFGNTDKVRPKPFSDEIESAIRYMRNNFDKKIDIGELADHVFLSRSGLIWKFNQELNTTPSNYLKVLRMRHAKHLLLNYSYSITQISEMCGYSNPYYFTNTFHHYTGMSPSEYRKHYLKGV